MEEFSENCGPFRERECWDCLSANEYLDSLGSVRGITIEFLWRRVIAIVGGWNCNNLEVGDAGAFFCEW